MLRKAGASAVSTTEASQKRKSGSLAGLLRSVLRTGLGLSSESRPVRVWAFFLLSCLSPSITSQLTCGKDLRIATKEKFFLTPSKNFLTFHSSSLE